MVKPRLYYQGAPLNRWVCRYHYYPYYSYGKTPKEAFNNYVKGYSYDDTSTTRKT